VFTSTSPFSPLSRHFLGTFAPQKPLSLHFSLNSAAKTHAKQSGFASGNEILEGWRRLARRNARDSK